MVTRSARSARATLTVVWVVFFVVEIGIVVYLRLGGWIEADYFREALKQLNELYAPYVGAILLYFWGSRSQAPEGDATRAGGRFVLALGVTLLWNGLLLAFLLPPLLQAGFVDDALANMRDIGGTFTWLVAGAIGFYFATPAATPPAGTGS